MKQVTITVTALPPVTRPETDPVMRQFSSRVTEEQASIAIDPPEAIQEPSVVGFQAYLTQAASVLVAAATNNGLPANSVTISVSLGKSGTPPETHRCAGCSEILTTETGFAEPWDDGDASGEEWYCNNAVACSLRKWTDGLPEDLHHFVRPYAAALPFLEALEAEAGEALRHTGEYDEGREVTQDALWHVSSVLEQCLARLKQGREWADERVAARNQSAGGAP